MAPKKTLSKPSSSAKPGAKKAPAQKGTLASKSPVKALKSKGQTPSALSPEVLPRAPEVLPRETVKKPSPPHSKTRAKRIDPEEILEPELEQEESEREAGYDSEPDSEGEPLEAEDLGTDLVAQDAAEIDRELSTTGRAISPTDPLRRYLDEVRRYPLLTPEEEISLATKLHESGDLAAAKYLVQANLRLVVKIAFEYKSVYANVMDLIQEGNIGLMKAVSKYDPTKGARLGYYSSWWIRSYILKYLLDNFRLVRVGTTAAQKKLFFHLMREKERLEAQGVLAAPKLLADRLQVREKDVVEMEKRLGSAGNEVSLDSPVSPHGERKGSYVELLEDHSEGADEKLAHEQLLDLVRQRLPDFEKTLNDRERRLFKDRLLAEEPKTLQEVADHYGLTRERARQIEAGVITKLKEFLKSTLR